MYYVGCDQHKKYSYVVCKDQNGNHIDQIKLYHSEKEKMKEYFSRLPEDSIVGLEACGFDHWIGDMLEELGLDVKLAHAAKTKAIAEERIKTDKISANVLADLLRLDMMPQAYRAPNKIRDERALMRYRYKLVCVRSMLKNKIHSIIDYQGIQQSFSDLFGITGRSFLEKLDLKQPYKTIIENYLSVIDQLSKLISNVDGQLRRQLKKDQQAKLLMTIPGIGLISAFIILAETGDIKRFKNRHKFARYIGIVPSLHQSGQSLYSGRITNQGNMNLDISIMGEAVNNSRPYSFLLGDR